MSDFLEDRLAALRTTQVSPPAPAELVRARGQQRRRRATAATALAGMALIGSGAAVAYAVTSDGRDALDYAPPPTAAPTASAEPSSSPTADATAAACTDAACSPAPAPAPHVDSALLLQPADAKRISGGTWSGLTNRGEPHPRLQVCEGSSVEGEAGSAGVLQTPGDGESVVTQVVRYGRPGEDVVDELRAEAARCPSRREDAHLPGARVRFDVLPDPRPGTLALRSTYEECETCADVVRYWLVGAAGRHVSYAALFPRQEDALPAWADAMSDRLRCAGACATPTPDDELGPEDGTLDADDRVRLDGIGPVVVGMTLEEAEAVSGQPFTAFEDDLGNGCGFVMPRSKQPDVRFMVVRGIVIRVDSPGAVRTDRGVGVGSTEDEVRQAYGSRVQTSRHDYSDGNYLRVTSADGRYVMVFETDGRQVVHIRTGTAKAASYNEGCA